jgi:probable F420-dependent oxidoreductase
MKIGAIFPQTEIGDDPAVVRDFAQAAEALGYSHILAYDHILGAVHEGRQPPLTGPYTERDTFHEPFVLFGYLAGITSRVELVSGVIILPQRQTVLIAKQAAEVDVLSGGRLRLGVGTGWNYVEYEALNEDFHNRGKRQEEQIEVMRRLWAEPVVDYRGRWHRVDRAGICPLPPRRQIPIWLGGFTEPAYRRAARIADGFIFGGTRESQDAWGRMQGYLAEAGRDPKSFGVDAMVGYQAGPERWVEHLQTWRDAGATHASIRTMNSGLAGPRAHIEALRTYMEVVGPAFKEG